MARPTRQFQTFSDPRHQLGLDGEEIAMEYLLKTGYALEAHRFKLGREEIDLIMRQGSVVAFVEVKTRLGTAFGSGGEAVGWRKRKAIGRVAEVWRVRYGRDDDQYRFDVVEVFLGACHSLQVRHIEDAWRVPR
jgi:putative endonuclease